MMGRNSILSWFRNILPRSRTSSAASKDIGEQSSWYPVKDLGGKRNYRLTLKIAKDGSAIRHVRLWGLSKLHREEVICRHFLSSYVRWVIRNDVGVTFISRDAPWDFGIELSTGRRFCVEITSIAENAQRFVERAKEERLARFSSSPTIPYSLLKKLYRDHPIDVAAEAIEAGIELDGSIEVPNPWYGRGQTLWLSNALPASADIFQLMADAIRAKANKPHSGKERTILLIDNRTIEFGAADLYGVSGRLEELRTTCPFLEVYLYTGFYSDDDGQNAEWLLVPILITDETSERFHSGMSEKNVQLDDVGTIREIR